jgi:hypothetical protein
LTELEKIAHLIRFGLSFHKMTVESIIAWADCKINDQLDNDVYLELSTARTTNRIVELFSNHVAWNFNSKEVRNLLLSYYKVYLSENLDSWLDIEMELLEYLRLLEYGTSNESVNDFLYFLDDDWCLRKGGYGGVLQMPAFLVENLNQYDDYEKLKELLKRQGLIGYEV